MAPRRDAGRRRRGGGGAAHRAEASCDQSAPLDEAAGDGGPCGRLPDPREAVLWSVIIPSPMPFIDDDGGCGVMATM